MAVRSVGAGKTFATIAEAVAASSEGDTIEVQAGLYRNDFATIRHDLALTAVGGTARLVATVAPPNGKAIITEGGPGVDVSITGFDISGAQVPDGNGAAIRYEGGTLSLSGVTIHHNQDGILAGDDPSGSITIAGSAFHSNGSGTGYTHGIYVNRIGHLAITGSTVVGTAVGHQVKSRAASTTITHSLIADGEGGTGSYLIDLPNGGEALIRGNTLQKGPGAQNPIGISFGVEGNVHPVSRLVVQGNTLVSDLGRGIAIRNTTGSAASVLGNVLHGWSATTDGPASLAGNLAAALRPALTPPIDTSPVEAPPVETPPVEDPPVAVPPAEAPPAPEPGQPAVPEIPPPAAEPPQAAPPVASPPIDLPVIDLPVIDPPPIDLPPPPAIPPLEETWRDVIPSLPRLPAGPTFPPPMPAPSGAGIDGPGLQDRLARARPVWDDAPRHDNPTSPGF